MSIVETYYLIDFENVHGNGLSGLETLGKHDHVYLFYTKNAASIELKRIASLKNIDYNLYEVPSGKQSLDMHLVSYLGYLIGINEENKCRYVIVSKDTDYNNIVSFLKNNTYGSSGIICKKDIAAVQKESSSKILTTVKSVNTVANRNKVTNISKQKTKLNTEIQRALSDTGWYVQVINKVASIVVKHYGEDMFERDIHNELVSFYGKNDGREIYQDIKEVLENYKQFLMDN